MKHYKEGRNHVFDFGEISITRIKLNKSEYEELAKYFDQQRGEVTTQPNELYDAVRVQLQIIKNLLASKSIVNLDESIAYYENLLKKYANQGRDVTEIAKQIEKECTEHISTEGLRFYGVSWAQICRVLVKFGYNVNVPF